MNRKTLAVSFAAAVLLAAAVLVAAGCGGDEGAAETAGGGYPVASAEVPFDQAFIDAMVPHHRSAVDMANEALDAGLTQPDLVRIATAIVDAQAEEVDQMLRWRDAWYGSDVPGPEAQALETLGLSAEEAGMVHGETGPSTATDVDSAFSTMMIAHHEGAIRMAEIAENRAQHAEIRRLAEGIVAAQRREIETMSKHRSAEHHG